MSYGKRQKSRKRRQAFRIIFIIFIFLYFIIRSIPSILAKNAKTILPEKGLLIEKLNTSGVIIKHETLINATINGEININSIEGKRIAAGTEVASINSLKDTSSLKQELLQIEESISALEKSSTETSLLINENEKIQYISKSLVNELQRMIALGKYDEIYLLKEQLALYCEKAQDASLSNTLVGQSLESLEAKRDSIKDEINKKHVKYYTNNGGIISYNIDGYEDVFLPKEFENYTFDRLEFNNILKITSDKSTISVGEPICKIIDNFQWYIALKLEDINEIKDIEVNKSLNFIIKDHEDELNGRIIAINTTGNKAVIVLELTTMLHDYYNLRFPKVEIIKFKKEGYKIPSQAIVDKDSLKGVYIKNKSGIVKFIPINILGQDSNYTYVNIDDISMFDEIFISPTKIKEGQILE